MPALCTVQPSSRAASDAPNGHSGRHRSGQDSSHASPCPLGKERTRPGRRAGPIIASTHQQRAHTARSQTQSDRRKRPACGPDAGSMIHLIFLSPAPVPGSRDKKMPCPAASSIRDCRTCWTGGWCVNTSRPPERFCARSSAFIR